MATEDIRLDVQSTSQPFIRLGCSERRSDLSLGKDRGAEASKGYKIPGRLVDT